MARFTAQWSGSRTSQRNADLFETSVSPELPDFSYQGQWDTPVCETGTKNQSVVVTRDSDSDKGIMDVPKFPDDVRDNINGRKRTRTSSGVRVNGPRLQALRLQAGLTQEELAALAGYSDRLIRKAESSGLLRVSTIRILAQTLSERGLKVTAEDLTFLPSSVAMEICRLLITSNSQEFAAIRAKLCDSLELHVAGEAPAIPFAGTFSGIDGLRQFMNILHATAEIRSFEQNNISAYSSADGEVLVLKSDMRTIRSAQQAFASVWWFFEFRFTDATVRSIRIFLDTGVVSRLLRDGPTP